MPAVQRWELRRFLPRDRSFYLGRQIGTSGATQRLYVQRSPLVIEPVHLVAYGSTQLGDPSRADGADQKSPAHPGQ